MDTERNALQVFAEALTAQGYDGLYNPEADEGYLTRDLYLLKVDGLYDLERDWRPAYYVPCKCGRCWTLNRKKHWSLTAPLLKGEA